MLFVYGMYVLSAITILCFFKRKILEYRNKNVLFQYLFVLCLALFPVGNSVICAYVLYRLAIRRKNQSLHT